jgi:hypothetical protein
MYTFANELLTKLNACAAVTITQQDAECYTVTVDLGGGFKDIDWEGGYWADTVRITDERLELVVSVLSGDMCWDEEEEYCFGEGTVHMHYADYGSGQLAYTSALESEINERIYSATNGILLTGGSEQGMQGYDSADDSYLSLDVGEAVLEAA